MNGALQPRPAPNTLVALPDILTSLVALDEEEKQLSDSLAVLLSNSRPIEDSLDRLRSLASQLYEIRSDAVFLTDKIFATAQTAERVGSRVRFLDEEMRRVREAGEWVAQVMELKTSLVELQSSIDCQDWESATRLCARAMSMPSEVTSGPFAESAVPTAESPLAPEQTLQTFRDQLRDIFLYQFQQASSARDPSVTTRFFKLFPPIGWEQEGLEAYASFVLDLVQTKSPTTAKTSSPLYYVTALTALFESVCSIVDQHQPVVEKYYGKGRMQTVIKTLIQECDKVVKRLIGGWEEERVMNRKIVETSLTNFSMTAYRQVPQMSMEDEEKGDPRDMDRVLNEISAIIMRFTAFRRFLYVNLQEHSSELAGIEVIETSACRTLFDNLVTKFYIPLEVWYLRFAINQAHKTSMTDYSQVPPTTTTPDLVFYILKSILTRLTNTGSVRAVEGIIKQVRDVMENDFAGVIRRKMDDVYRNESNATNTGRAEKSEKESRLNFVVLLNDLDISSTHMERLIKDILSSQLLARNFLQEEINAVQSSLSTLLNLVSKFRTILKVNISQTTVNERQPKVNKGGIDQIFNQLMRPRLRTLIPDVYKDVSYMLDEDGYSAAEYHDFVRKRFLKAWDGLTDGFKDSLTESNYRVLFGLAIDVLVRPWEKYVMTLKYSELGAIRFDRDTRVISTYLCSQVTFGDMREKFQRLQQMSTLLNIDKDEDVDDFFSSSGIAWKLTMAEARAIVGLKL